MLAPVTWRSLPPREAWIEIHCTHTLCYGLLGRFPRGKRGLKFTE